MKLGIDNILAQVSHTHFSTTLIKCSRPGKFFKVKSYRCDGKTEKSFMNPYKAPIKCDVQISE